MTKTIDKIIDNKKNLIQSTFLSKANKKIKISDVITEKDCWFLKRKNTWILTHNAIKILARIAGISQNFDVEESAQILPEYRNELEHIVRVTIHCKALRGNIKTECVHSDEISLTMTGEANRINTPDRGRGYLRKMAEKRAYDIAVLEHLGLYSTIYSEEEADSFEKTKESQVLPGSKEFEQIVDEVNAILNADTKAKLSLVAKNIKTGIKNDKYSDMQISYLRSLHGQEYAKRAKEF